ncbi:hypothetical protein NHQ30_010170 [Ciborinia camelliae]|nr:hypothetical protein NHQ30_010170 [Ciborinia camelliae]
MRSYFILAALLPLVSCAGLPAGTGTASAVTTPVYLATSSSQTPNSSIQISSTTSAFTSLAFGSSIISSNGPTTSTTPVVVTSINTSPTVLSTACPALAERDNDVDPALLAAMDYWASVFDQTNYLSLDDTILQALQYANSTGDYTPPDTTTDPPPTDPGTPPTDPGTPPTNPGSAPTVPDPCPPPTHKKKWFQKWLDDTLLSSSKTSTSGLLSMASSPIQSLSASSIISRILSTTSFPPETNTLSDVPSSLTPSTTTTSTSSTCHATPSSTDPCPELDLTGIDINPNPEDMPLTDKKIEKCKEWQASHPAPTPYDGRYGAIGSPEFAAFSKMGTSLYA